VAHWRAGIEAFDAPNAAWADLQSASLRFLTSWLPAAVDAGYDELQLWGAFPHPNLDVVCRRQGSLGLVPALATGMGCSIAEITASGTVVTRRLTGARLVRPRRLPDPLYAVPWWLAVETARRAG
jgi:hypothetical protein